MRNILSVLLFFCQISCYSQLVEQFTDGDFTRDPPWTGDRNSFVVNAAQQLQSNGPAVTNTVLQLVTPCRASTGTSWEFWARLNLATSSGNYADIFLMSDQENLSGSNSGYFVRLGGTPDEVSLFRKDAGGATSYVVNGRDGTLAGSTANVVRVKVTRDLNFRWTLWVDLSGTGQTYVEEGSALDDRYRLSAYFGVLLRYSSANSQRFFFDDFSVTDRHGPVLQSVVLVNARQLELRFNEAVAENDLSSSFRVSGNEGVPATAALDPQDPARVHLTFARDLAGGTSTIRVEGLADLFGNRSGVQTATFTYTPPVVARYRDVRINEVLADPYPPVGLPEAEFLELYNASDKTFNLKGWQYSDATASAATLPAYLLAPGGYVILCRAADTLLFKPYGRVLGLAGFPPLNDGGDAVELFDDTGRLVDRIRYGADWYRDAAKSRGGWSLELINPSALCGQAGNYRAALHPDGGTPGRQNSVFDPAPDTQPPALLRAEVLDRRQVRLQFSEPLDSLGAVLPGCYGLSHGVGVQQVTLVRPDLQEVLLHLDQDLPLRQVIKLEIKNLKDCPGNALHLADAAALVVAEPPGVGDVVVNEVLFNPRSGGVDFVEVVNRSPKYLDLKNWQLGNIRSDSAADRRSITAKTFLLAPQQYLVLTTKPEVVWKHYPNSQRERFLALPALPSYPDEAGTVQLWAPGNLLVDQLAYHEDMHFRLLSDRNGVSLERIRLAGDSSRANWHSAASTVGYATPGLRNSQHYEAKTGDEVFSIEPKVFTPDGDGDSDFATINYRSEVAGAVASITIFDSQGREIRRLVRNELLARDGFFRWDGLDARGRKVGVGYYVLLIELLRLGGQVKTYKETVVVGTRL